MIKLRPASLGHYNVMKRLGLADLLIEQEDLTNAFIYIVIFSTEPKELLTLNLEQVKERAQELSFDLPISDSAAIFEEINRHMAETHKNDFEEKKSLTKAKKAPKATK